MARRGRRRRQRFNKQAFASPRAHSEAFRILRTNLDVALAEQDRPVIAVTSANPGEGKTATTVNLARSLALTGRRVMLVDLDLRHPDAHHHLKVTNEPGASEVLRGLVPLGTALQYVPVPSENLGREAGLWFLPTGAAVPDPAEMLDGTRTDALLERLSEQADVVLIDTPPLLPVADTLVIARRATGAVLVIEARRTPIGAIEHARTSLQRNETPLLGVIVNKLQARDARQGSGYGYGYGYGYGGDQPAASRAGSERAVPATGPGVAATGAASTPSLLTTTPSDPEPAATELPSAAPEPSTPGPATSSAEPPTGEAATVDDKPEELSEPATSVAPETPSEPAAIGDQREPSEPAAPDAPEAPAPSARRRWWRRDPDGGPEVGETNGHWRLGGTRPPFGDDDETPTPAAGDRPEPPGGASSEAPAAGGAGTGDEEQGAPPTGDAEVLGDPSKRDAQGAPADTTWP